MLGVGAPVSGFFCAGDPEAACPAAVGELLQSGEETFFLWGAFLGAVVSCGLAEADAGVFADDCDGGVGGGL